MSNLSALVGAILFAWMPDDQDPHRPGPKYRPVLVVKADPSTKRLCVAYGTSQHVERNGKGEVTFRKEDVEGLSKDTKFCFRNMKWIPVAPEYLSRNRTRGNPDLLGFIPKEYYKDVAHRLQEVIDS